jgi:hypothetical protein
MKQSKVVDQKHENNSPLHFNDRYSVLKYREKANIHFQHGIAVLSLVVVFHFFATSIVKFERSPLKRALTRRTITQRHSLPSCTCGYVIIHILIA